jgi:threonine/homoserine/homoserine lactone efflux protein
VAPGELLAPALGIALSPFGIIPAILLLFTPAPRANAGAFLGGWVAGVLAGALAGAALGDLLAARTPGPWLARVHLAAAAALLGLAVRQWARRGDTAMPGWMARIGEARPRDAARLGMLLSLANPKVLLLAVSAGLAIVGSGAVPGQGLLRAALLFTAGAATTVALPLAVHLLAGPRVLQPLGRARGALVRHNGAIGAAVLAVIGLALLSKGLTL